MDHSEVKHLPKTDHTPAELDEASLLLLKTAGVIEERGWCQNSYGDKQGRLCILGAMRVALKLPLRDFCGAIPPAGDEAMDRLSRHIGNRPHKWNDAQGRTQAEVVAKLRAVALSGSGR